jgi:hypothetical protein
LNGPASSDRCSYWQDSYKKTPQFSFVIIQGVAKLYYYKQKELFKWATKIARRYMGMKKHGAIIVTSRKEIFDMNIT